jgi:hypothetical protein
MRYLSLKFGIVLNAIVLQSGVLAVDVDGADVRIIPGWKWLLDF